MLTVSLHGHPGRAYPYFAGYADETGDGDGRGYNLRNLRQGAEAFYRGWVEGTIN